MAERTNQSTSSDGKGRGTSKPEIKSPTKSTTKPPAKSKAKPKAKPKAKSDAPPALTAATADKYQLYQWSVQSPDNDVAWFARVYKRRRGQQALHLREDFCGTGVLAATWVARGPQYTADGYDIDPEPIDWGLDHNVDPLGDDGERVHFYLDDARARSQPRRKPDIRAALNFSYWIFQERTELLDYFRKAYRDLNADGLFVLDTYGGPEAYHELEEAREIEQGFTYVWEQASYQPVTGNYRTYIHFRFPDGSEMKRAFRYNWRLWTLPELCDLLTEAGFSQVETYWEGTAENGTDGNGVYRRSPKGENCLAWVTYVMAWK